MDRFRPDDDPEETFHDPLWRDANARQRPREFDPRLADRICDAVANGADLVSLCTYDRDLPLPGTFLRWVAKDPLLAQDWQEAVAIRTTVGVEEMLLVAEDSNPHRARVRFDARRFHAERLMPTKYGPRAYLHNGDKPENDAPDYGSEIRRKLDQMADRHRSEETVAIEGGR